MIKNIIVTPYNPEWPGMFEAEAVKIREALGDACIAVHHVGSTSVPGLSAKPVIDVIGVVAMMKISDTWTSLASIRNKGILQILFFKELGFTLKQIQKVLDKVSCVVFVIVPVA